MHSGEDTQIEADVAVIGGGTAGTNSAMAAAEMGLKVLVVDKANINRTLVEKLLPHVQGQEARDYQNILTNLRLNFVKQSEEYGEDD